ncbi:unnamed protein product [Allacma fusca]|uniref:Uncharacterized protein n=1 Tax=Allacma fusca TaxID=39272 RepID=A0A8J2Q4W1_9HEXA|nr:unnamed protein product [Allacma fusca]
MENFEDPELPEIPVSQSTSGKMRFLGIKLKLFLTVAFLAAGFVAWELVSLKKVNRNYDLKDERGISVAPDLFEDTRRNISLSYGDVETRDFILTVANCSIPYVPIRGKVVSKKLRSHYDIPNCREPYGVQSSLNDNDELVISNADKYSSCCYAEITRPEHSKSDRYRRSQHCEPYTNKTKLTGYEFFLTECTTSTAQPSAQVNFHANIPMKKRVQDKIKYWSQIQEKPISVMMIVLDSASRSHAFRSLPRTLNLLLANMNFEDFKGHHILGEPTMPNIIPLLLGASSSQEFWKTQKPSWTSQWDGYPFIWKKFTSLNYVTMFLEDDTVMGTFNYGGQTGFNMEPTDYYPRPLFVAHREGTLASMSKRDLCFGNQTIPEFSLNYHFKFLKRLQSTPTFSVNWMCRPHHDVMEGLQTLDGPLFNFFRGLSVEKSLLANTLVILTSDHGYWSNSYAQTHEGLIERRLPLLLMRLPEKLLRKHPEFRTNVQNNVHRITSHHDTYQTLVHISQLASDKMKKRKKVVATSDKFRHSLFEHISVTRTCADANIPAYACACNLPLPLDNPDGTDKIPDEIKLPPVLPNALPFN